MPATCIERCLPTKSERPRNGPQWVHEVKHDGYRLMVRRNGDRVRLFTRHGYDWTERYPRIAKAMAGLKVTSALIDGEAVWISLSVGTLSASSLRSKWRPIPSNGRS